jgi:tight adherence protein C
VVAGVGCGQPLEEGLDGFARRLAVDEAAVFARMVGAAQRRGVPLAPQLEGLADSMRAAERHRVEARARTAPIRMLFPLAFLILPSFLLLSAVPVLVNALHQVRL